MMHTHDFSDMEIRMASWTSSKEPTKEIWRDGKHYVRKEEAVVKGTWKSAKSKKLRKAKKFASKSKAKNR